MSGHDVHLSKTLSFWLRHNPQAAGLNLDPDGWAEVDAVLSALRAKALPSNLTALRTVVALNDKQRFELSADERRIRARQGHSVAISHVWPRATPPALLYHGTVASALPAIRAEGLKRMRRHHVHLSPDVETARRVGARRGAATVLTVRAGEMEARGHAFFLSGNGVWLTKHVPAGFLVFPD